jgi:hypothetical protein
MAMEVGSKQLHKHALPVVALLLVVLAVSAVSFGNSQLIGRNLFKRIIRVQPTTNGLAKITVNNPNIDKPVTMKPDISQAGQAAVLAIEFHTASE